MNPVDHVRPPFHPISFLNHQLFLTHINRIASRWWKPSTHWQSLHHFSHGLGRSKGRSHRRAENGFTSWNTKNKGLDEFSVRGIFSFSNFLEWLDGARASIIVMINKFPTLLYPILPQYPRRLKNISSSISVPQSWKKKKTRSPSH